MAVAEFRAALRTFSVRSERASRHAGLTPRWYLMLLFIKGAADGSERLSFAQLANRLKLSRNTVSELVRRVEAAGLIGREQSATDGRVFYLRLTPEGEHRLATAIAASERDRAQLARDLAILTNLYGATNTSAPISTNPSSGR